MRRATVVRASWRLRRRLPHRAASCSLCHNRWGRLVIQPLLACAIWATKATSQSTQHPYTVLYGILQGLVKAFTANNDGPCLP